MSIAFKWGAGNGIAIALLIAVTVVAHEGEIKYRAASAAAEHSASAIDELDELWASVIEAESGLRGFVITGDPAFLDQFDGQPQEITRRLDTLQHLVAGNPRMEDLYVVLSDNLAQRLENARTAIAKRRTDGFESAASLVSTGQGRNLTDEIRTTIDEMVTAQRQIAAKGNASTAASFELMERVSIFGLLGVSLLVASAGFLFARGLSKRVGELVEATRIFGSGNLAYRLEPKASDEIGQIAHAVNDMAERLRQSREALASFAYTVSHDLRSPLHAMHGFSEALIEDFSDQLGPQGQDYAKRIASAAIRMEMLLNDILVYSRVERENMDLKMVPLDTVVDDVLSSLTQSITDKHAVVSVDHPLPPVVGYQPVLEQALTNLVSNALKFAKDGSTPEIRISAQRSNGTVRLSVADKGIGIDPDHHRRIFNVFERLHGADSYPGTGIGLAIVRKGIERMGGRTGVESALGQGSRFWIELPPGEAA